MDVITLALANKRASKILAQTEQARDRAIEAAEEASEYLGNSKVAFTVGENGQCTLTYNESEE